MSVLEILDDDLMVENLQADSKIDALSKMTDILLEHNYISDKEGFLNDVLEREKLGTTGIGDYVAIPHGQSDYVNKTTIMISKLQNEIEWETLDGKGVKVIVLFVVKNGKNFADNHLAILSEVASYLADETKLHKLLNASNKTDIKNCFV